MAKVICTLPNASKEINSIRFVSHKLGMISEEIEESTAKELASISGYHLHDSKSGGIVGTIATADVGKETSRKPTPESLATAASTLSADDHTKLIDLLMDQETSMKSDPKAPAANVPAGGKDKSASAAQSGGSGGSAAPPKAAGGKAEPTF
jgi:hypothetical protein